MKLTKRILSLLLIAVMLLSMVPMFAAAADSDDKETKPATTTIKVKVVVGSKTLYTYNVKVGNKKVTLEDDFYIKYKDKYYEFVNYKVSGKQKTSVTIPAYDGTATWTKKWGNTISVIYKAHSHKLYPGYGRIYHWDICSCGYTSDEERHVDPATDADKICTCGYKFNDNADLVTLWLENMNLSPRFNKETTEYIGELITYKDVTSTSISVSTFDALATVKLPDNLEIHEGANKFEIVVTAEDKAATKTYTVIAVKPVTVEDVQIGSDGTTASADLKAKVTRQIAAASISEAVGEKLVEMAVADACSRVAVCPDFSKWSTKQIDLTLTGTLLKSIAEKTKADLTIQTPYESVLTIPNSQLTALAEQGASITVSITKEGTFCFTAGEEGKELTGLSDQITLTLSEKAQ